MLPSPTIRVSTPMKLNPQILIVDDEPRMRDMLERAVTSWGHKASTARSGEEALRVLQTEPANIILLDLNLPAMSGLEFLERFRQSNLTTQVIILTGFGDLEAAKKAIHLDVVEFLTKPCHLGELERALDRARRRIEEAEPLPTVEGVVRLSRAEVEAHLGPEAPAFEYGGQKYRFQHLAFYVGREPGPLPDGDVTVPVMRPITMTASGARFCSVSPIPGSCRAIR